MALARVQRTGLVADVETCSERDRVTRFCLSAGHSL